MKKNLFYLFALICSVSLFTACSDDDNNDNGNEVELISGPMVGTWQLADEVKDDMDSFVSGPIDVVWEAPEGTMLGLLQVKDLPIMAESMGSKMLVQVLKDITLDEKGNILATYSDSGASMGTTPTTPNWKVSEEGYATYKKVSDNQILVFLNLEKILSKPKTKAEENNFAVLMDLVANGIPVNIKYNEGAPQFFIDKNLVDKLVPVIVNVVNNLPDNALGEATLLVKMLIASLPDAMAKTTKFEVGIVMKK